MGDGGEYGATSISSFNIKNVIWYHNKLVSAGTVSAALDALHAMSLTPRRYTTATAIEALANIARDLGKVRLEEFAKYGSQATLESVMFDRMRLALKRMIAKGWQQRRSIATQIVCELTCYNERELSFETSGLIDCEPLRCRPSSECCLGAELRLRKQDVAAVEKAIPATGRREDQKRKEALRHVRLGRRVDEDTCRSLGDAVIVLQCPNDAGILTTNGRDHQPLAEVLGKRIYKP
jgi:hypothetical protein